MDSGLRTQAPGLKINIGAGCWDVPNWTNLDHSTPFYDRHSRPPFVEHDLQSLAPLPFETGSVDLIYCSHVIEHLTTPAVENMLAEAMRILKSGGGIRIATPDLNTFVLAYTQHNVEFLSRHFTPASRTDNGDRALLFLRQFATALVYPEPKLPAAELKRIINGLHFPELPYDPEHPDYHINHFDAGRLVKMLRATGETCAKKDGIYAQFWAYQSGYGKSMFAEMTDTRVFDRLFPDWSLYVEAVRS